MTKKMHEIFPPPDTLLELEPEEIAAFLLYYLCESDDQKAGHLNRKNFTSPDNFAQYASDREQPKEVARVMTEAWVWLEREGMIIPKPGESGEWRIISRRGQQLRNRADLEAYKKAKILPKENLDGNLLRKVWPLFIRGDYDMAILQAFKEVEIRVRKKTKLSNSDYGAELMKKAFHPKTGILTDKNAVESERQAIYFLFMGSIGIFKNPSSHREINFNDPGEVAEIILFANYALRVVDRCSRNR